MVLSALPIVVALDGPDFVLLVVAASEVRRFLGAAFFLAEPIP